MTNKNELIEDLENIAKRNGLLWEVRNEATRLMEAGVDEVDALQFACVNWDLI